MNNLLVSIITVSYNSVNTISDTIKSVLSQTYPNIEYIIIDGFSNDGTNELIKSSGDKITKHISEEDNGIYDAMNKGIKLASGEIIGILNSDDFFYSENIIEKVVEAFNNSDVDAVYGDIQFVDCKNTSKVVRYYSSKKFNPNKFKYGIMPAHPSFYVKKELFDKIGDYKTNYKIAADYELLLRFLYKNQIKSKYIELPFVSMRTGGVSNKSIRSNFILNKEIKRACTENGIKTNYGYIYSKYFKKVFEFFGNKSLNKEC